MARESLTPRRRGFIASLVALTVFSPLTALHAQSVDEFGSTALKGAGSTFAHPLMSAWAREYRGFRHGDVRVPMAGSGLDDEIGGVALDYEAIGSQAGIQRLKTGAVDFAVSEMPLAAADLRRSGLLQVPLVVGAVAVALNLAALGGRELRLSQDVVAQIYLGRISTWDDAQIAALNPGLPLPAARIGVVHRADGSGTTYTFTAFLAQANAEWKSRVGSDLLVQWPVGQGFRGSSGVAGAVQRTPNSIGYLDAVQARSARLQVASVANAEGRFVAPDTASVQAAAAAATWDAATEFNTSLVNLAGRDTYPVVAAVFGLASAGTGGARQRTREFFAWSMLRGRATAERIGYVALPPATVALAEASLRR